ncbi:MAG: glycosyltransferase family 8 protein [Clostridia bacterium]|nr:glycosyltransferase family 8 protein [Clostridia bacterium]
MSIINYTPGCHIPIFFSTDDEYIPFLDVAISSLIDHADPSFDYRIIVFHTGLKDENMAKIKLREKQGFAIDFIDITSAVQHIRDSLKHVYHFAIAAYYRIFIASLFPEYDKVLYLDCDLVVLGDIAKLFNTDLGNNILGGAPEEYIQNTAEFRVYTEQALGLSPDAYINSGVLLMNLKEFRACEIERKFIELITKYDFDLLDPDQAYLNFLCKGKILMLPNGWNKEPMPVPLEGNKNIVHYALYKKPWQYDDVTDGEYFWKYAKLSPFYEEICARRESFGEEERAQKAAMAQEILQHALKIVELEETFSKKLC